MSPYTCRRDVLFCLCIERSVCRDSNLKRNFLGRFRIGRSLPKVSQRLTPACYERLARSRRNMHIQHVDLMLILSLLLLIRIFRRVFSRDFIGSLIVFRVVADANNSRLETRDENTAVSSARLA